LFIVAADCAKMPGLEGDVGAFAAGADAGMGPGDGFLPGGQFRPIAVVLRPVTIAYQTTCGSQPRAPTNPLTRNQGIDE
jgi:hypothetical protein